MSQIIDECSDDSDDFTISQYTPEKTNPISHEDIIEASPSPFKNLHEKIDEINSPEIKKRSINFSRNASYKRKPKKRTVKRNLLETMPSLDINVFKKKRVLGKDCKAENTLPQSRLLDGNVATSAATAAKRKSMSSVDQVKKSSKSLCFPCSSVPQLSAIDNCSSESLDSSNDCQILFNTKRDIIQPDIAPKDVLFIDDVGHESQSKYSHKDEDIIVDVNSQTLQIEDHSQEVENICEDLIESPTGSSASDFYALPCEKTSSKERNSVEDSNKEVNSLDKSLATISRAPKKGTLLEKTFKVISAMKKDAALLSHEISVGLRTCRGSFVSDPVIVQSVKPDENYYIIGCIPSFNYCDSMDETDISMKNDTVSVKMFLFTTELPLGIQISCSIVIHFPVLIMFDAVQKEVFVFVENRLQIMSTAPFICPSRPRSLSIDVKANDDSRKIYRNLKSRTSKNVLDAVVGNSLIFQSNLEVTVLHMYKTGVVTLEENPKTINFCEQVNFSRLKIKLLTLDSEGQFCTIFLSNSDRNMEVIEIDAVYNFVGFCLTKCINLNGELKCIMEYYSGGPVSNEYMYTFESTLLNPKINFVMKAEPRFRPLTAVNSLFHEKNNEQRIKFLVKNIKHADCQILISDNEDTYLELKMKLSKPEFNPPTLPFFLEGIYLKNNILHFDKYSRIGGV